MSEATPHQHRGQPTALGAVWMTLTVAAVTALALGGAEAWAAARWSLVETRSVPVALRLASAGKAVVTHALFWGAWLGLLQGLAGVVRTRLGGPSPGRVLTYAVCITALGVIVPADLHMAGMRERVWWPILAAIPVAVIGDALRLRVGRWIAPIVLRRGLQAGAVVAAVAVVVLAVALARSPLLDPGGYRIPAPAPAASTGTGGAARPNVVWVVLDTVRPDHVQLDAGAEGNTPNLAALSKGCRVYRQARSDSMWTVPSHASMFSGLDVPGHGMTRPRRLPRKIRTLAQSLGELGYRSTSISANPWISGITDLTRGFDSFTMSDELRRGGRFSLEYLVELAGIPPPLPWLDADRGAALANHLAAGWLQGAANSGEPFFLFVNYMDAHLPYVVPADYRRRQLSEAEVGRSYAMRRSTAGQITDRAMAMDIEGPQSFDARAREILRGQYAAAIGYLDMRVGELARHLRALGVQDDTLLVITSDHGEYLGEHDMWSHRFRAFDAVSRVVLMLCGRGVEPGGIDGPALLSDLHDTVLRAATGATLDPRLAAGGHDLLGAPPATGRLAATRYAEPAPGPSRGGRPVPEALATPEWSFYRDGLTLLHSDDGRVSLFDVRADPSQRHDVSGQQTEALRSMLLLARERLGDASSPQRDAPKDLELPKSTVEALRSLGYTGD